MTTVPLHGDRLATPGLLDFAVNVRRERPRELETALRAAGAAVERVLTRPPDWSLEPGTVGDADFVLVTNPCNPMGRLEPAEVVSALARPGRLLVVDESFIEFARERESLAHRRDVVVIRSATKLWSLAAVRAGYLLGPPELVERLEAARQPWPVNGSALAALRVSATLPRLSGPGTAVPECGGSGCGGDAHARPGLRGGAR